MSNRLSTNIFLAHTPLQNFIAAKIVSQYFSSSVFKNVVYTSVLIEDNNVFDEVIFINKAKLSSKIVNSFRSKRKIIDTIKKTPTSIFMSHTSALLDNYFFYSFPGEKYGLKVNFYYEGVLYFYKYLQDLNTRVLKNRKYYGLLCNIKYSPNPLIFPSYDKRVNNIYSILPRYTLGTKEKIKAINIIKKDYLSKEDVVLIMGGKPTLLSNEEVISIYNEMITLIKSKQVDYKVYFKGHHADTTNNFFKANNNKLEIVDITQNKPIEEVIENYNPSLVLSYPSSGLINLKAMYGDKIDVISYYINDKKHQIEKLEPVFHSLKIKLKLI